MFYHIGKTMEGKTIMKNFFKKTMLVLLYIFAVYILAVVNIIVGIAIMKKVGMAFSPENPPSALIPILAAVFEIYIVRKLFGK